MEPSAYELSVLDDIRGWRRKGHVATGPILRLANLPFETAGRLLFKVPGVTWLVDKTAGKLATALNTFAQSSVRHLAIHREYRADGHTQIQDHRDMLLLDLAQIDRTIGRLAAKYKALALAQGVAAGFAGLGGIPVDVAALAVLNLRAVGEYATYCGFDIRDQRERLFAMNVLGFASGPTPQDKKRAMAQLSAIAREVATRKPWKELKKHALFRIVKQIAKALGIRLTKAKLAQLVPAAGAVVGGVFNAQFTASVCDAAHMLYRERFLTEKYGDALIGLARERIVPALLPSDAPTTT